MRAAMIPCLRRQPGKIVGPFADLMGKVYNLLFELLHSNTSAGSLGLAIIIFTLIVKLILFPLMVKQQKSSFKMQALQPELMKIRKKYEGKTDQMSQQRMAFEMQEFQKTVLQSEYLDALKAYHNTGSVAELAALFKKEQDYYWNECQYFFAE